MKEKNLSYVIETGVPDPKKRCEAVTYKYKKDLIITRCRRDDTKELKLGKHVVKLCVVHRSITLQEFEEGCRLYLQYKERKEKFGPVVQSKRTPDSESDNEGLTPSGTARFE